MITLTTFGRFQVSEKNTVMDEKMWKSAKVGQLFVYLVMNRERSIGVDELTEHLWQNDDLTDNPGGALKNLVYRLRKGLKDAFGDREYILSGRGSYKWNTDVAVKMDVEDFEKYLKSASADKCTHTEQTIKQYEQAVDLYNGDFLLQWTDIHWIATLNTYYHSQFITIVKSLANIYAEEERYNELEKLCNKALTFEYGDEQIYCYLIEARMRMKKVQLAFESYEKAKTIMDKELGVRKTTMLNKVYDELLAVTKGKDSYDIDQVKEDMNEENMNGVFFCGYPVFKEIYHLEVRKSERTPVPQNLVLFTFFSEKQQNHNVFKLRIPNAMKSLEHVLKMCLRVGDVAAKYSDTQYIVLLSKCDYDVAPLVADRIVRKFKKIFSVSEEINIKYDIEPVSPENSMVNDNSIVDNNRGV